MADDTELSGGQPREQGAAAEGGILGGPPPFDYFRFMAEAARDRGDLSEAGFLNLMEVREREGLR